MSKPFKGGKRLVSFWKILGLMVILDEWILNHITLLPPDLQSPSTTDLSTDIFLRLLFTCAQPDLMTTCLECSNCLITGPLVLCFYKEHHLIHPFILCILFNNYLNWLHLATRISLTSTPCCAKLFIKYIYIIFWTSKKLASTMSQTNQAYYHICLDFTDFPTIYL